MEKLRPELRFPEFKEELKNKKLEDITVWASGGTPSKDNLSFWNGDIPWISASSMRGTEYSDSDQKITEVGAKNGSKLARKGSLLLLVRGSMLFKTIPVGIVTRDVAFNQDVKSIVVNSESTSKFILYWFLYSEPLLLNMVTGTGIGAGKIDLPDLKSMKIALPSLPEQTKIAEFLTAIDKRIELLTAKKEKLTLYKKGVMQKIFNQEIRFKPDGRTADDGGEFPDWEEKYIEDVCTVDTGNKDTKDRIENGDYPFFVRSDNVERIDSFSFDGEAILTSGDGVGVGKNFHYINGKFNYHQRVYCLKNFREVNGKYVFYFFSVSFYSRVMRLTAKNSVDSVRRDMITKMSIPVPTVEEQIKIANFFTSLDIEIQKVEQQITLNQTYKKGLLQQMFV